MAFDYRPLCWFVTMTAVSAFVHSHPNGGTSPILGAPTLSAPAIAGTTDLTPDATAQLAVLVAPPIGLSAPVVQVATIEGLMLPSSFFPPAPTPAFAAPPAPKSSSSAQEPPAAPVAETVAPSPPTLPAPIEPVSVTPPEKPSAEELARRKAEQLEEKAQAKRAAAERAKEKAKEQAQRSEAKAEAAFADCKVTPSTVLYTSERMPRGEYKSATTVNPFCQLSRQPKTNEVSYDAELIAAEREWLAAWRANPTGKLPQEPVSKAIKDGLNGAMRRAYVRLMATDERPEGWNAVLEQAKAAWNAGDHQGAIRIASSYINTPGAYCIHDPDLRADCKTLRSSPKAWLSEYTPGPLALFERGGGDCRDYSVARWLMLKMVGVSDRDQAIMEGGHANGAHQGIVHVWNVLRVDGRIYVADYPTQFLDRSLVPMQKASWLSSVGALDVSTETAYAGFGMIRREAPESQVAGGAEESRNGG